MHLLGQSADVWLNPEHPEQQEASTSSERQPAAPVHEQPTGGNANSGDCSSHRQQPAAHTAEQAAEAGVQVGMAGREGGVAQEQATAPDVSQQADGSSKAAGAAVALQEAATASSKS